MAVAYCECCPAFATAKKRRRRHAQCIGIFPNRDVNDYAISIGDWRALYARVLKIEQHIDTLFLDAEGRSLGEARRLDAAHPAFQGFRTTPIGDQGSRAHTNLHRILRDKWGHDFQQLGIAHLHDRRPGRYYGFTFVQHS